MGRGTPTTGNTSQQPMISDTRYRGPQQGSPNDLTFGRGPIPQNQQGPALGGSVGALAGGLGQLPLQQQQMGQVGQNLFNMMRGQPATQQPALTPAPANRPDPNFNINNALNTFSRSLNDRIQAGQMSVADAQRAQAEMRALQLNPAMATRQAATEIAQRHLQVGPYSPANVAAQQAAQQRAMQQPVLAPPPAATPAATPGMPQGWNAAQAYRDFGGKLAQMIKSGQLTTQQANAIKDPAFQATKLGNTPAAFAAMQKALAGLTGYAAGGYATQVAPEDPRMQAMRYLQRLGK